jgi:nucleotide-binding universal stress UspA family protein
MEAINKILAPTDLSDSSKAGVRYALEMAASVGAEVILYYVAPYEDEFAYPLGLGEAATAYVPGPKFEEYMRQRRQALDVFLNENFSGLPPGLKILMETDVGTAHEQIVEKAEQANIDLIVMSTHGRTGLGHILIGSVTEYVVRQAKCPVLSIRSE